MQKKYIRYLIIGGGILLVLAFLLPKFAESKYLAAAKAGGDYLAASINDDGSFVYEYDPVTGEESDSYNVLRHAGTTYSLLELYEVTGDKKYLKAAERALDYLRSEIVPCPVYRGALCVLEDNEIKLGGNGLALLTFAKYMAITDSRDDLATAEGLAAFITVIQAKNGEFLFYKMDAAGVPDTEFVSEYYPGEAMFALAKLSEVTGDRKWVESAHKGAHWIINVRDKELAISELPHDHWFLYTLNELTKDRQDPDYLSHTRNLVDAILSLQHKDLVGEYAVWNGGYYIPPRNAPTATRNEGLGAAYMILKRVGDDAAAQKAFDAMEQGVEFTLRTQDENGGFHESLEDMTIRIDYVQHTISALLAFDRIRKE